MEGQDREDEEDMGLVEGHHHQTRILILTLTQEEGGEEGEDLEISMLLEDRLDRLDLQEEMEEKHERCQYHKQLGT